MNLLKHITTSIAIVCLSAILAGCGGSSDTPEGVVQKQINAMKKWDTKTLTVITDLDDSRAKEFVGKLASIPEEQKKDLMTAAEYMKIVSSEIKGKDAIVVIWTPDTVLWSPNRGHNRINFEELREKKIFLENKNGKWLIQW